MNKTELTAEVAYRTGLTKKYASEAVDSLLDVIYESVCKGEKVNIKGFGTFELKKKNARKARNPVTKETIDLPETFVPAFKPGQKFKDDAIAEVISEEMSK